MTARLTRHRRCSHACGGCSSRALGAAPAPRAPGRPQASWGVSLWEPPIATRSSRRPSKRLRPRAAPRSSCHGSPIVSTTPPVIRPASPSSPTRTVGPCPCGRATRQRVADSRFSSGLKLVVCAATRARALPQRRPGTWTRSSCCGRRVSVPGTSTRAPWLPRRATWRCSSGPSPTAARSHPSVSGTLCAEAMRTSWPGCWSAATGRSPDPASSGHSPSLRPTAARWTSSSPSCARAASSMATCAPPRLPEATWSLPRWQWPRGPAWTPACARVSPRRGRWRRWSGRGPRRWRPLHPPRPARGSRSRRSWGGPERAP
mmetsp:Transcript_17950/g.56204  ORF Transcript_17950/g.56204 Transcript_17950/m.56204 type:complete len:317 (+) Transcript_17950:600-1550(+)